MDFLTTKEKKECFGCEACVQVCPKQAIVMQEDEEGFRYPLINTEICIKCDLCHKVCPAHNMPAKNKQEQYYWGGYHLDKKVRFNSTSGGAFSAIVDAFCDRDYVIFGAEAKGLVVYHTYITDKRELSKFRKSKYSQSIIGPSYKKAKQFLNEGKKVLFSGTPCQIAGLKSYLEKTSQENLLTVEVICEGVPSPLYMRKYEKYLEKRYGCGICELDYRYTGKTGLFSGKWDFQMEKTVINRGRLSEN